MKHLLSTLISLFFFKLFLPRLSAAHRLCFGGALEIVAKSKFRNCQKVLRRNLDFYANSMKIGDFLYEFKLLPASFLADAVFSSCAGESSAYSSTGMERSHTFEVRWHVLS